MRDPRAADTAAAEVRSLRRRLGVSQEQLAGQLGVSFVTVNRWENGRTRPGKGLTRLRAIVEASSARLPATTGVPTSFVGREEELDLLRRLLRNHRLVTITGFGGCGKTRLASEFAATSAGGDFPASHAVAFGDAESPEAMLAAVSRSAGVHASDDVAAVAAALAHEGPALLILDNCEGVADEAGALAAELVAQCRDLRILATSRRSLRVDGECVLPLEPLPVPGQSGGFQTLDAPASRLFIERAQLRQPGWQPGRAESEIIAAICARLDGIPLAIELAASRVGSLPLSDVLASLENDAGFLRSTEPTRPERHRALDRVLSASVKALSDGARHVLEAATPFAASFSLEALSQTSQREDIRDVVGELVDSSLLRYDAGEGRYRLLETIRGYVSSSLPRSRREAFEHAHAECYADLLDPAGWGGNDTERELAIGQEVPNLRAAYLRARERGDRELQARLLTGFASYWSHHGMSGELLPWLDELLGGLQDDDRPRKLEILMAATTAAMIGGDTAAALRYARAGVEQAADAPRATRASAQIRVGVVLVWRGEYAKGQEWYESALSLVRGSGPPALLSSVLSGCAYNLVNLGRLDEAATMLEEALDLARGEGNAELEATALVYLGDLALARRQYEFAEHQYQVALALLRSLGRWYVVSVTTDRLAQLAGRAGRYREALEYHLQTRDLRRTGTEMAGVRSSLGSLAIVLSRRRPELAAELLGAFESVTRQTGIVTTPGWRPGYEEARRRCERVLGAGGLAAAFARGQRKSPAKAFNDALDAAAEPVATRASTAGLSPREAAVARCLPLGWTSRQIAGELGISARTVEYHLGNIYGKLGVVGRAQAVSALGRTELPPAP